MGTRADFYVGRGPDAEWLGSIAWDGYPDGIDRGVLEMAGEASYRLAVLAMLQERDDGTLPEQGWPWPWSTSHTTDYAYAFDEGQVWASCFGHPWFDPKHEEPEHEDAKPTELPDMAHRQATTWGKRSGLIVIGPHGIEEED